MAKGNGVVSINQNILTIPNFLTGLRLVLLPIFAVLLFQEKLKAALLVFFISGVSDFFDGFLARRFNTRSRLGTYLDPIADHSTVVLVFLLLSFSAVLFFRVPLWLFLLVGVRDLLVGGSELSVLRIKGLTPLQPIFLGKVAAFVNYITAGLVVLANIVVDRMAPGNISCISVSLAVIYLITGTLTVISGLQYLSRDLAFWAERRRK